LDPDSLEIARAKRHAILQPVGATDGKMRKLVFARSGQFESLVCNQRMMPPGLRSMDNGDLERANGSRRNEFRIRLETGPPL
jgi:hypothetical protein